MRLRPPGRSNGIVLAVLIVLLVLLPLLISAVLVQDDQRKTSEDRTLAFEASTQSADVADYFEALARADPDSGQEPILCRVLENPDRRVDKIRAQINEVRGANEALAHLESLFPGSIGEACFIDAAGRSRARRQGSYRTAHEPIDGRDRRLVLRAQLPLAAWRGVPIASLRLAGHERMGDCELSPDRAARPPDACHRSLRGDAGEPAAAPQLELSECPISRSSTRQQGRP